MKDAFKLLTKDHRKVSSLFRTFKGLGSTDFESKKSIISDVTKELSMHASIEEQILYPQVRKVLGDQLADHSLDEHLDVKKLLYQLENMAPQDNQYDSIVEKLESSVEEHVREEENEIFAKLRAEMGESEIEEMFDKLESAKKIAPTRPHPGAPNKPPGVYVHKVVGAAEQAWEKIKGSG